MSKILFLVLAFALTGCQLKGGDPVVTTTGKVPTPVVEKTVKLTWSAASGTVQGYKIEASLDNSTFVELGVAYANAVAISGLASGKKYYFRIRAFNQGGNSAYTSVVPVSL